MRSSLRLTLITAIISCAPAFGSNQTAPSLTNGALRLRLDLDGRCVISEMWVHGRRVSTPQVASFTGVMISNVWFTTCSNQPNLRVKSSANRLTISGIRFGPVEFPVEEEWTFTSTDAQSREAKSKAAGSTRNATGLHWEIQRRYPSAGLVQDSVLPAWSFESINTWTGALLDNGGVAWNRYLDTTGATYGVKASGFVCWKPETNSALSMTLDLVAGNAPVPHARFTHERDGSQTAAFSLAPVELKPKHDLRRFNPRGPDLWAPFSVRAGTVKARFKLAAVGYERAYDLGELRGLSESSIRQMLHTIARYGVIDRRLVGANGWRSGFKCLHEQWFSQIGLALQDPDYVRNCAETFDYERDHALLPDGRLKSRWWWVDADARPGTFDKLGYYECQWGMLLDTQTCFPICVAELFDLTGDRAWLARHKTGCERMLDYLLRRDTDGDGLVEMLNDLHSEAKGSDWIDVIWAAHENALVNAELYYALVRWAELENLLGDHARADRYSSFAQELKESFNRPTGDGGFWDPQNRWYIYWRDKDNSLHGNNLVTPVNFAAIAYGLCDQADRRDAILQRIESEMQKENLFYWPLSFFPYEAGEGHPTVNYPFPKYENGDIFLSWGELGVRAYAATQPEIALKYIRNTLRQYERDGLSFQRYERRSQTGTGDDILAGNCMPVVGLYRNLYGVQPKHNRLFLDPRLTPDLDGTQLRYQLRGQNWQLALRESGTRATVEDFALQHKGPFSVTVINDVLQFFPGTNTTPGLEISRGNHTALETTILQWGGNGRSYEWTITPAASTRIYQTLGGLRPGATYRIAVTGEKDRLIKADSAGTIRLRHTARSTLRFDARETPAPHPLCRLRRAGFSLNRDSNMNWS